MADSDDDIDEDDDDSWASVDEDDGDGEEQLDPDQFNENALKGDTPADENVNEAKASAKEGKEEKEKVAVVSEKEKKRKMNKVFKEISQLPPPGCLDAAQVTADDLENVFCLSGQTTLIPITVRAEAFLFISNSFLFAETIFLTKLKNSCDNRALFRSKTTNRFARKWAATLPWSVKTWPTPCCSTFVKLDLLRK